MQTLIHVALPGKEIEMFRDRSLSTGTMGGSQGSSPNKGRTRSFQVKEGEHRSHFDLDLDAASFSADVTKQKS